MDNVTLETLLNDPNMLTKMQNKARRERARAMGELLVGFAGAVRRGWSRLVARRASAGRHAAHCG